MSNNSKMVQAAIVTMADRAILNDLKGKGKGKGSV